MLQFAHYNKVHVTYKFYLRLEKTTLRVKIVPPKKSSCLYVCQYCLVHLGDIGMDTMI